MSQDGFLASVHVKVVAELVYAAVVVPAKDAAKVVSAAVVVVAEVVSMVVVKGRFYQLLLTLIHVCRYYYLQT